MKLVIIESPYAGAIKENTAYARRCMKDSLLRGEFPLASHLLYTQEGILNDSIPHERDLGINAGLAWGKMAHKTVVYVDMGLSKGMKYGILDARIEGREIEYRYLDCNHKNACSFHENAPMHCPDCGKFPDGIFKTITELNKK